MVGSNPDVIISLLFGIKLFFVFPSFSVFVLSIFDPMTFSFHLSGTITETPILNNNRTNNSRIISRHNHPIRFNFSSIHPEYRLINIIEFLAKQPIINSAFTLTPDFVARLGFHQRRTAIAALLCHEQHLLLRLLNDSPISIQDLHNILSSWTLSDRFMRRRILIPIDPEPEVFPEPVPSEPTALGILNWVSSNQIPAEVGSGIVIETRTPIKESGVPLSESSKFGPWIPVPELRQYPSDTKSLRELQATIHGWFSSHDILLPGFRENHDSSGPWKVYEENGIKYEQYGSYLRFKYPSVEPWTSNDVRHITEELQFLLGV